MKLFLALAVFVVVFILANRILANGQHATAAAPIAGTNSGPVNEITGAPSGELVSPYLVAG